MKNLTANEKKYNELLKGIGKNISEISDLLNVDESEGGDLYDHVQSLEDKYLFTRCLEEMVLIKEIMGIESMVFICDECKSEVPELHFNVDGNICLWCQAVEDN